VDYTFISFDCNKLLHVDYVFNAYIKGKKIGTLTAEWLLTHQWNLFHL